MNVYKKLALAREKFHAAKVEKTGFNNFAKYAYFELADFTVPALSIFADVGLVGVVSFGIDAAKLTIVDTDKPEDQIVIESPMSTCEMKGLHAVQQLGAVQSYLRRYLWVAALEIVEHDALDATTGKSEPAKKGEVKADMKASGPELIFNSLQPEEQIYCRKIAARVVELMPDVSRVVDMLDNEGMDAEHKTGVWWLLDSATRSAIKREQDKMKSPT